MILKKKILYIVEAMGGGVFTYIVNLANKLEDEYDMYIAYATRSQTPKDYRKYFDKRIHLIKVKNFNREINIRKDLKAIREVRNIVRKIQPDIIHLHSSKAGVIGRVACNGRDIPLFYTPHGYCFLMQNYSPMKRMAFKMIEAVCAKRKCITISCSFSEHQETLKLTKHAFYVNNAVNILELEKMISKVEIYDHPFTVFTLGRICYQKNPVLFNQIAEILPDVRFLWIGEGELKNELKSKNIEVTGWVDRQKALELSINSDVFVLTSLWEGLPISLLEAMYMKKLCVVSDVVGNHDVIENGVNGFVCREVNEFADAIKKKGDKFIIRAYKDIEEKYNTCVQVKGYLDIYKKALKEGELLYGKKI